MRENVGRNSLIASIISSFVIAGIFLLLALLKNSGRQIPLYTDVDIMAGMIFVFILGLIVSASIWPGIMEKRLKENR